MTKILVTPMFLDDIWRNDKKTINTNNCWSLRGMPPSDYKERLAKHQSGNWIYRFHDPISIRTLTFSGEDLLWMKEAARICEMTRQFSHLFDVRDPK
jgi:hypothetical protein